MPGLRRRVSQHHFQVVVVGSGFAGSLMAMICQRLGRSTALIERGRHPRFAIGESSTPLANLLLEEISEEYQLPFLRPLCKWGPWQRELPRIACGLKRGFTFYHHEFDRSFATDASHRGQLLVGASPIDQVADTHWYRPHFDQFLVTQAQELGVTYWDETQLTGAREEPSGMRLAGTRNGQPVDVQADFVIDASGPRGFLHRALGLPEKPFDAFPGTQALFAHFQKVGELPPEFSTLQASPPYPPEQAAVHHLFPGGWIWVLKFNNAITSAGVAATDSLAQDLSLETGEAAWKRLLDRLPSLRKLFASARPAGPFVHLPRLAFRSGAITGSNWALLPSAAGFVDPLLSTGFPLTLLGVIRLGRQLRHGPVSPHSLAEYSDETALELETASRLVGSLYRCMDRFDLFKPLSLLYFAASSYSETVRRLGKPELADGFLLCRRPGFGPKFQQICELANRSASAEEAVRLVRMIRDAIEPFDVAGLNDPSRDPWYPADPADLLRHAGKLAASETEIRAMLRRCGLDQGPSNTR
jgi:tetracycline 7-halogenase / FADH2 O2-dependent halogenase